MIFVPKEILKNLIDFANKNICSHEETYRAGANWEVCSMCGQWADYKGGKPEFQYPEFLDVAQKYLNNNILCSDSFFLITGKSKADGQCVFIDDNYHLTSSIFFARKFKKKEINESLYQLINESLKKYINDDFQISEYLFANTGNIPFTAEEVNEREYKRKDILNKIDKLKEQLNDI